MAADDATGPANDATDDIDPTAAGDDPTDDDATDDDERLGLGRGTIIVTLWLTIVVAIGSLVFLLRYSAESGSPVVSAVSPVTVSAAEMRKLPQATTFTSIPAAPVDKDPFAVTAGTVIHPLVRQVLYSAPGAPAVGVLPDTELGEPTWVPVVGSSPGWAEVLLPCRPDRATGWIYTAGAASSQLQVRSTPYLITIDVRSRRLTAYDASQPLASWTVAVGAAHTPTPTGRTFLLALLAPPRPTYSPLILPLGTHSNVLSTFGGGPGTVGVHGWPDPSVFGHAISNGCVRVPADALKKLAAIPLGTLVLIT